MNLSVLYEDNHLIVVEKPIGVLSQSDITNDLDMLTIVKDYLKDKYNKPGNVFLGLVHRLDRMTGGVMVFAKTSKAASRLSEQIRVGDFHKKYYCLVQGIVPIEGHLEDYLYKNESEVKSYVVSSNTGKLSKLDFKKISDDGVNSLVDVSLLTGRHHQIRVQFANIKHPLVGDALYGRNSLKKDLMLFAYHLSFNHPITKERLEFNVKPKGKSWNKYFD